MRGHREEEKVQNQGFTYGNYIQSDATTAAQNALNAQLATKPQSYVSKYGDQLSQMADDIINRKPFQYDINSDALYNQYKDQYVRNGNLAMQDAMGQAATMTGGYGNSYAQTTGQQVFQQYMAGLNDKVPELYNAALNRYQQEGQSALQNYGLLSDREAQDYGRYQDDLANWNAWTNYLANRYDNERGIDLDRYYSDRDFAFNTWKDQQDRAWQEKVWQAQQELAWAQMAGFSSGGGGGGGSSYSGGGDPKVDTKSVLNLGYGPVSPQKLDDMVNKGQVSATAVGNKIVYTQNAPQVSYNPLPAINPTSLLLEKF